MMIKDVYEILKEKGITSPRPPAKGGVYTPVQEFDDKLLYCSNCGLGLRNGNTVVGRLRKDLTVGEGQRAAYNCMPNLLASLSDKTGDLDRIKRLAKIPAFANSTDDFGMQLQAVNGGFNLVAEPFGEKAGLPARSTIGTNALPDGIICEVEALVELE